MKPANVFFILFFLVIPSLSKPQTIQKYFEIGELNLVNGNVIFDCKIGYRTIGKMNEDSSNIIIYPTWFEGTSKDIITLIEKYNFIDTTRYFIISIDALGNGISTSASNYGKDFPQITIRDMVNSQYKLLTEQLGIDHIFAVIGGSMGSMQALEWSVLFPDFMEKVVAYSTTPKMSTYDLLLLNTRIEILETLKGKGSSEKEIQKITKMMTAFLGKTPGFIIENIKPENFPEYLSSFDGEPSKTFTSDDFLIHLKAMRMHDISQGFNSMEDAAKNIKAEMFIIVSTTDMLVNPTNALKLADILECRKLVLNNTCGHLAPSCEIERVKEEINQFLSED